MYNVEGKCNVWKSVGAPVDLPYNETEIVSEKKGVRYAVNEEPKREAGFFLVCCGFA